MDNTMQRWEQILGDLDLNRGPIQQRYRLLKTQLEMYNKSLEHNISQIQHFESLYTLHSNRIKKIIVVSLMVFLSSQKKYLNFGKLEDKHEDN